MGKTQFKLSNFEGSLDILLFLLRKNEVNIYDIPIAQITEQYLSILKDEAFTNLDTASDFYLMAATLMHIKSRMLLSSSTDIDEDAEDPRQELVERLIEYQKYKKLTSLMSEQTVQDEWTIEREKIQRSLPFPDDGNAWKELDVWELMITFSRIIHSLVPEHLVNLYEEVSINEKITLIQEKIQLRQDFSFTDIVTSPHSIWDILCAFLAVLELVKTRSILIYQNKFFGDIIIKAYETRSPHNEISN